MITLKTVLIKLMKETMQLLLHVIFSYCRHSLEGFTMENLLLRLNSGIALMSIHHLFLLSSKDISC